MSILQRIIESGNINDIYILEKNKEVLHLSFEEAKSISVEKNIKTSKQFHKWNNRPKNMPFNPDIFYKNKGWKGWNNFLETKRDKFISLEEFKKKVLEKNIRTRREFYKWKSKPKNIPSRPDVTYLNKGWFSWSDVFGKSAKKGKYARDFVFYGFFTYEESKKIMKNFNIKNRTEYSRWKERPKNIPSRPEITYEKFGWKRWDDFLGKKS